mmetsp:Transcript_79025/g.189812  ORF Transcript_79025/g.189812 Transcript_79025/m.189812 type:complete len:272 (-) Transcript_79025:127-942(-)
MLRPVLELYCLGAHRAAWAQLEVGAFRFRRLIGFGVEAPVPVADAAGAVQIQRLLDVAAWARFRGVHGDAQGVFGQVRCLAVRCLQGGILEVHLPRGNVQANHPALSILHRKLGSLLRPAGLGGNAAQDLAHQHSEVLLAPLQAATHRLDRFFCLAFIRDPILTLLQELKGGVSHLGVDDVLRLPLPAELVRQLLQHLEAAPDDGQEHVEAVQDGEKAQHVFPHRDERLELGQVLALANGLAHLQHLPVPGSPDLHRQLLQMLLGGSEKHL